MPKHPLKAAAKGMPQITRRSILGGLAASTALLAAPRAEAGEKLDTELLRLEAEFNVAYDRFDAATERRSEIESRVFAAAPARPKETPMPKELDDAFGRLSIEQIRDRHPVCQAMDRHRREYRECVNTWRTECEAVERENGLPQAKIEQDRLMFEAGAAAEAVLDMPASSINGVLAKLRVHDRWTFDEGEILGSITTDIQAMADAAVVPEVASPVADESRHPWIKVRRLARELSAVLNDCDEGTQMAEIYPSKGNHPSILFTDIAYLRDTARERLTFHAQGYARAAREIDPMATECYLGEAIDPKRPDRFQLIVSRKA